MITEPWMSKEGIESGRRAEKADPIALSVRNRDPTFLDFLAAAWCVGFLIIVFTGRVAPGWIVITSVPSLLVFIWLSARIWQKARKMSAPSNKHP